MKRAAILPVSSETDIVWAGNYKDGIARLVSLMEQIKSYALPEVNELLDTNQLEQILNMPEVADRDWNNESSDTLKRFLRFLGIHISVYEKALKLLEAKRKNLTI